MPSCCLFATRAFLRNFFCIPFFIAHNQYICKRFDTKYYLFNKPVQNSSIRFNQN